MQTDMHFTANHLPFIALPADFDKHLLLSSLLTVESDGGHPAKATKRPAWALFGKVGQNMETSLFKEKFVDWPDQVQLTSPKGRLSEGDIKVIESDIVIDVANVISERWKSLNCGFLF